MAAMENSEVVKVLREIRDIQWKAARFYRQAISVLVAVVIAAFALFACNFLSNLFPWGDIILFYAGWLAFLVACGILASGLIRYLRYPARNY